MTDQFSKLETRAERLEKKALQKSRRRRSKRKPKMALHGRAALKLQKIIKDKANRHSKAS